MSSPAQSRAGTGTGDAVFRALVRSFVLNILIAVVLILISGRPDWYRAWAYVALTFLLHASVIFGVYRGSPDLMRERSRIRQGTKRWDRYVGGGAAVAAPLAMLVVAARDVRFRWPPPVGVAWGVIGFVGCASGGAIVLFSMRANRFFATTVRIQTERGHKVVDFGPYRRVRHPGYVGMILFSCFAPLALGSWWAFIPAGISAGLFVLRTALEDRTLRSELPGYAEYARRVRYRLVPGIW